MCDVDNENFFYIYYHMVNPEVFIYFCISMSRIAIQQQKRVGVSLRENVLIEHCGGMLSNTIIHMPQTLILLTKPPPFL